MLFLWWRFLPELPAVTASRAPHAPGVDSAESSDGGDEGSAGRENSQADSTKSSELVSSCGRPTGSAGSGASCAGPDLSIGATLAELRDRKRKLKYRLNNLRARWSTEEKYVRHRLRHQKTSTSTEGTQGDTAPVTSDMLEMSRAIYRSVAREKKAQMDRLERDLRSLESEEARLVATQALLGTEGGGAPPELTTTDQSGSSTSATETRDQAARGLPQGLRESMATESPDTVSEDDAEPGCSYTQSGLSSLAGKQTPEDRQWAMYSGSGASIRGRLLLLGARKRKVEENIRRLEDRWTSLESYMRFRTGTRISPSQSADAPARPLSPASIKLYTKWYTRGKARRQNRLSVLRCTLQILRQEECALQEALNADGGGGPPELTTTDQSGPSTSATGTRDPAAQGLTQLPLIPTSTVPTDLGPEVAIPGCSWWTVSPAGAGDGLTQAAVVHRQQHVHPLGPDVDEADRLMCIISGLRCRRKDIRNRWRSLTAYVSNTFSNRNQRRKAQGLKPLALTPALQQHYAKQYRERADKHLHEAEDIKTEIRRLEKRHYELLVASCRGHPGSHHSGATDSQRSGVVSTAITGDERTGDDPHVMRPPEQVQRPSPRFQTRPASQMTPAESEVPPLGAPASPPPFPHSFHPGETSGWSPTLQLDETSSAPAFVQAHPGGARTPAHVSTVDTPAAASAVPCSSGEGGGPEYSHRQFLEHQEADHSAATAHSENDIPEEVLEFILSHTTSGKAGSGATHDPTTVTGPPQTQPWFPPNSTPLIGVHPAPHPIHSHWWPRPSSTSSVGSTSGSGLFDPGRQSPSTWLTGPQPPSPFRSPTALVHGAHMAGEPVPPVHSDPVPQYSAWFAPSVVVQPPDPQPSASGHHSHFERALIDPHSQSPLGHETSMIVQAPGSAYGPRAPSDSATRRGTGTQGSRPPGTSSPDSRR
uniref:Uncharacterized protein n=1 Tax=Neospora caninum (strain Liverpool) TaxID=572307 RepID=A0A0F7ULG7_NEOCL|nr:TPA: hypothetical protein BN1204_066175 [Neospora caninum Liverpool]